MHLQLGDVFTIVVFSPEYAREVMKLSVANEIVTVAAGFAIADLFPSAKWLQLLTGLRPKFETLHQKTDQIFS
ncbi:hypothetical protein Lalb_Chr13g0297111 [Lupinus albus]|uniref:Uncharacterized protein n=1 Tax=Lupinus albus TaxID=3870 RepID=A0A6A4PIU9_LUPAL|nr:hypothetical protein Lalb_Chr13g0297111 [Lupinus albus]